MAVALCFVAQRLYPIAYEWKRLAKLVVVSTAVFILGYWFWTVPWQKAGLLVVFPIMLFLTGFFEKGELKRITALFRKDIPRQQARSEKQPETSQDLQRID